jgi:mycothiol synthase
MNASTDIRACQPEADLTALTDLVNVIQGTALTPDQVLEQITWPGHDLSRDRFVAVQGGRLVGMSMLSSALAKRFYVSASVHPDFRRQGIGRALLERVCAAAQQRGSQQAISSTEASNTAGQAFAAACGFEAVGEERFFTAPPSLTLPAPQLPQGFSLHSVAELQDTQVFVDACNRSYRDMWGHSENVEPVSVEKIEKWRIKYPNILRPAGMFVILAPDGSPVAVTRADRQGEGAEEVRVIDAPGVAPEYRPLGLQRALVQAAAAWLEQNGSGPYRVETWGDSPEAVQIYQELGFQLDEASHSIMFIRYLQS